MVQVVRIAVVALSLLASASASAQPGAPTTVRSADRESPSPTRDLGATLDALLATGGGTWSVLFAEIPANRRAGARNHIQRAFGAAKRPGTGGAQTIYAHHADRALIPASVLKLLTTSAALYRLGPTFAHRTRVLLDGRIQGGILFGDLWIVGEGDPTISHRFDSGPLLDDVAAAMAAAGIQRVEGDLVVDDRAFDRVRLHPDWDPEDAEHWYGAEVSALLLNEGCVEVEVSGGKRRPTVRLTPQTEYVRLEVLARLTNSPRRHVFSLTRRGADRRTIRVSGRVWRRAQPYRSRVPAPDPSRFFAAVLLERLRARGVSLAGRARRARSGEASRGEVVWTRSAPLVRTLTVTNQRSHNLYAECLLKTLGRLQPNGQMTLGGDWPRGAEQIEAHALACGVDPRALVVRDGSGLSRRNRLSAGALVAVLTTTLSGKHGETFARTLARPGVGTLRRRLRDLPTGATLRAKTGTLSGVRSLAGVLEARGRRVVFAILRNGSGSSWRARTVQDRIVRALAERLLEPNTNRNRVEGQDALD